MDDVEQTEQTLPTTTREAMDAWLEAGWSTDDTPDWHTGGYVTRERAAGALRLLADQIDDLRARLGYAQFDSLLVGAPDESDLGPATRKAGA